MNLKKARHKLVWTFCYAQNKNKEDEDEEDKKTGNKREMELVGASYIKSSN